MYKHPIEIIRVQCLKTKNYENSSFQFITIHNQDKALNYYQFLTSLCFATWKHIAF